MSDSGTGYKGSEDKSFKELGSDWAACPGETTSLEFLLKAKLREKSTRGEKNPGGKRLTEKDDIFEERISIVGRGGNWSENYRKLSVKEEKRFSGEMWRFQ